MARFSRRKLLRTGVAAGVFAATGMPLAAQAQRGGRLRMALNGAHSCDSWDSRTHTDIFMIAAAVGAVFDALTEVAADGTLKGELAESWDCTADAKVWTFNLRKGVAFHNGAPFGAEDVIASLQLHRRDDVPSGARPIVDSIARMQILNDHQVRFTLVDGNADFPYLLSDHHLLIYPAGQIEAAMAQGIGTGLYKVQRFIPGALFAGTRVANHYKDGEAGWFDEVEIVAANDASSRMKALLGGRADVVSDIDLGAVPMLNANAKTEVFEVAGNRHVGFPMRTDLAPFSDPDLRLALKHAVDREAILSRALMGYGSLGNDSPIGPVSPYCAAAMPQTPYDPDKARFHLRKAGYAAISLDLAVSEAAFTGASVAAAAYRDAADPAGIELNLVQAPSDGYWAGAWRTAGFRTSCWSGRPTEDWMLSTAYAPGAPWNETHWTHPHVAALLAAGRQELDSARRAEIYGELQEILRTDGGTVIPVFAHFVGAKTHKLAHAGIIGNVHQVDSGRIAERWWMA